MTATPNLLFAADFGRRVAMAREHRQVSQRLLSSLLAELGVTMDSAALSRLEQGKRAPKLQEAAAIADALHMPLADLMPPKGSININELARVQNSALEQIDAAIYKLTGVAGQLVYFAELVEADPSMAAQLWPAGVTTWQEWVEWTVEGLVVDDPMRQITPTSLDRYADISHALSFIAESVTRRPYDPDSDLDNLAEEGTDGEHQATP